MATRSEFYIWDQALNYKLGPEIIKLRDAGGLSYAKIVRELDREWGITCTEPQLIRWLAHAREQEVERANHKKRSLRS